MKLTKILLKCWGISVDAADVSLEDSAEETLWSTKSLPNHDTNKVTYLDDGYIIPSPTLHFKTLQPLSSRDIVLTNDSVEITLPIEVNVIVVSQTPMSDTASETTSETHTQEIPKSHDIIPENPETSLTMDVTRTKTPSKIKKLKRTVKYLLRGKVRSASVKETPVTVSDSYSVEAPVCAALERLRQRRASHYV